MRKALEAEQWNKDNTPRFPVVLVHGLLGFDKLGPLPYWRGIQRGLESIGN
jgi:hypothetical protein